MIISDKLLMSSTDLELVLAHLDAAAGKTPSLGDDPGYQAAVEAIYQEADILQAVIANSSIVQRISTAFPIHEQLPPETLSAAMEALTANFQELPNYDLLILADAVTDDEQIGRLGIVYKDSESAEMAGPILLDRLGTYPSFRFDGRSIDELLADRNVSDPRTYIHQGAERVVLVLEFPTPKATSEEMVKMVDIIGFQGTTTPPGQVFRLFYELFLTMDTGWLSTITQVEFDAIQIGP
jgi:hypothetical protein